MKPVSKTVLAVIAVSLLLVGLALGWFLREQFSGDYQSFRDLASKYEFITPLLFVEVPEEEAFPEFGRLKQSLTSFVDEAKGREDIEEVSIYFRNLNTSQWVGVNADERFAPASMLKVTLLMAILRIAELDPEFLARKVRASGVEEFTKRQPDYPPTKPMVSGEIYTIEELINKLVIESDNAANVTLYDVVGDNQVMKIYDDLQMHRADENDPGYTPAEYSRLFRSLYNGSYLSREQSEHVLRLLSQTTFTQGLVSGVPDDVVVSHKFGIRSSFNEDGTLVRELHDCGIVYYPEHPYFLCVMTRGYELKVLEDIIARASSIAWEEVVALRTR